MLAEALYGHFILAPADFGGQPVAEQDETGAWTDYIFTGAAGLRGCGRKMFGW